MTQNAHQLWLRQLQDQQMKRLDDGDLTETEQIRLQNTLPAESNSKTLMEAIGEVTGNINEEPEQLDEIPVLAAALPAIGAKAGAVIGAKALAGRAALGVAGKALTTAAGRKAALGAAGKALTSKTALGLGAAYGVGSAMGQRKAAKTVKGTPAVTVNTGPQNVQASRSPETYSGELQLEKAAEFVSYKLIEDLEQSLGKRLTPEEIEEFVENNYSKIMAEASNQVTAHAVPGDLHNGVGASTPEVPKDKVKIMKTKAARFNPRRSGTDY